MCVPSASVPRPPTPSFHNFPGEVEKAKGLYLSFKSLRDDGVFKTTDVLAQAIFSNLDKNLMCRLKIPDIPTPYQVDQLKEKIGLGPFDILRHLPRWNCILLIEQNNFKFFIRHQEIYELTEKDFVKIEETSQSVKGYVIIFSTTCFAFQLKMYKVWLAEEHVLGCFYHYCPPLPEYIKSKTAPFHHEAPENTSSLCGLHALNAYLGCRYLSPQKVADILLPWMQMVGYHIPKPFDLKSLSGLDATMLACVIDQIAHKGELSSVHHKTKIISCSCQPSQLGDKFSEHENSLLEDFERIDRFILGVAKTDAHFLTFRKDEKGVWWKIDSDLSEQEAFENAFALIANLKETYEFALLQFIIPDITQNIRPAEHNAL